MLIKFTMFGVCMASDQLPLRELEMQATSVQIVEKDLCFASAISFRRFLNCRFVFDCFSKYSIIIGEPQQINSCKMPNENWTNGSLHGFYCRQSDFQQWRCHSLFYRQQMAMYQRTFFLWLSCVIAVILLLLFFSCSFNKNLDSLMIIISFFFRSKLDKNEAWTQERKKNNNKHSMLMQTEQILYVRMREW